MRATSQITADDFGRASRSAIKEQSFAAAGSSAPRTIPRRYRYLQGKTCHGENARAVNREIVPPESRSNSHLPWTIRCASGLVLKGTAGDPLISRWGQNVPGSPGTRLPGGNNDGLSARPPCAIVLCCGMIQAESGRQTAIRARRIEGPGLDALPTRINHVRGPLLHFNLHSLGTEREGETFRRPITRRQGFSCRRCVSLLLKNTPNLPLGDSIFAISPTPRKETNPLPPPAGLHHAIARSWPTIHADNDGLRAAKPFLDGKRDDREENRRHRHRWRLCIGMINASPLRRRAPRAATLTS
ncbi:hypothetical protein DBV15_03690 [Temnothorax longispinosus]|uniref:Uncharacterized protein n=1 Tax=Temnothorax longispinosus TaxID=300112 RepID=A0A4S2KIJ6_9HYME|nr:hypothetical protein DBV15_03690 [Temnothorax longispinosus]